MMSSNIHVKIRDIGPGSENLSLVGIIIRKQKPRLIHTKKDNIEKCVLCFTLRDSPSDLINMNAWGTAGYIENLYAEFQVGDVVQVSNVKAVFRKIIDGGDIYQPSVTSSFYIMFNENQSELHLLLNKSEEFLSLLNIPTKPPGNFLTISDIQQNGNKLRGQFVNLLAGIRDIKERRQINLKNGRNFECRNITLIDQSYSTLQLTIYENDILLLSEKWQPKNTVLFLADVRVEWNIYLQMITVSTSGRTIVTANPTTNKATNLRNFLMSASFQSTGNLDQIINKYNDLASINTVMSCFAVITKTMDSNQNSEFTALVYVIINSFDIDDLGYFIVTKCMRCNSKVDSKLKLCLNSNCPSGNGTESPHLDKVYDIRIMLTDHTGSLTNCRLTNSVAQKIINYEAALFGALTDEQKTTIKWKYLLKYCAAKLVVLPMKQKRNPIVLVISIDLISLSNYSSLIPMC